MIKKTDKKTTSKAPAKKAAAKKTSKTTKATKTTKAAKAGTKKTSRDLRSNPAARRDLVERFADELIRLGAQIGKQVLVEQATRLLSTALGLPSA